MTRFGRKGRLCCILRVIGLSVGCLALAQCANGNVSHRVDRNASAFATVADVSHEYQRRVVGGRPTGCPRSFCGCEASLYLFGHIRPDLNLASNWIRKFPRTSPAPGMAAVRNHHVFVLINHVDGSNWLVHDGNSGNNLTHEHVRSIKGYTVVNPRGIPTVPILASNYGISF